MDERMKAIAMDKDRENLVVFKVANDDAPDMYIWVCMDEDNPKRKVKVTDITEFPRYGNWTGEGLYVGKKIPQDKIDDAFEVISVECKEFVLQGLEKFRENMKQKEEKGGFGSLEEWDKEITEGIERIQQDEDGENNYNGIAVF